MSSYRSLKRKPKRVSVGRPREASTYRGRGGWWQLSGAHPLDQKTLSWWEQHLLFPHWYPQGLAHELQGMSILFLELLYSQMPENMSILWCLYLCLDKIINLKAIYLFRNDTCKCWGSGSSQVDSAKGRHWENGLTEPRTEGDSQHLQTVKESTG